MALCSTIQKRTIPSNKSYHPGKCLFNTCPRSHGQRRRTPTEKDVTDPVAAYPLSDRYNNLLSSLQQPLCVRYIRTNFFSLTFTLLKDLRDFGLEEEKSAPFR